MTAVKRRETLTAADVDDFVQRAASTSSVIGLDRFAWWPAESVEVSEVTVYSRKGKAIAIVFRDIVPDSDGVFFFGWDEESRNAVWKWAPGSRPETQSLRWGENKRVAVY